MKRRTTTKLALKPVHLKKKIRRIQEAIERTKEKTPPENSRLQNKLDRWMQDIGCIEDSLEKVERELLPKLEKELGLKINNKELLEVAMFQPSTKNIFLELETHYKDSEEAPFAKEEFDHLVNLSEMSKVLALLGDAAISMAVVQYLWSPKVSDVGTLTQERADIVSNEHMADICDRWDLYDHRIHFDPAKPSKEEMDHDKGTLLEAVYGIIQIERGFKGVQEKIGLLFEG